MVVAKEDLALTLSLSCSNPPTSTTNNININITSNNINSNTRGFMMNNNTSTGPQLNLRMAPSFAFPTPPVADRILMGIDVNIPACDNNSGENDDVGVSSPNSTVSTLSGKRSSGERDFDGAGDEADADRSSSRGLSDEEDGGENSRKKLRLSKDQAAVLEESFKEHSTLNPKQKQALAKRLGLRPRQVEVWFQNRRARTKLKQTEVDCEFLKNCAEKLTEENRRLQKEAQELRALKLSPQFYRQMTPPTTLTICPSCERVASPGVSTVVSSLPNHRPMPINMWAGPHVRPFEGLQPRS